MEDKKRKELFDKIYYGSIGMCGYGKPNDIKNFFFELLENHRKYRDCEITYELMVENRNGLIKNIDPDVVFEIIFHVFEHCGLVEHGSSVYSSWFTDEGLEFLSLLKEFKDID